MIKFLEIDYKKNVMADMNWTKKWVNENKNYEYLFVLQKEQ